MRKATLVAGLCAAASLATPASATKVINQAAANGLAVMKSLNLVVLGNWTSGHEVEGKAWAGGNVSGSTFNVGTGNASQKAVASSYATLTVGGVQSSFVNINNGANGGAGTVAAVGDYGATIGGNSAGFTLNGGGGTVKIGGSISNGNFALSSSGAVDLSIHGFIKSVTAGAGSSVKVGSVGGSVQVGADSTVQVASGNTGDIITGANGRVAIGGSVNGQLNVGAGTIATVAGGVSQATLGNGSTFKSGGSVGGLTTGNNSFSTISGNLGANFNVGAGSTTRIGGQYQSQNVNGLPAGATVAVSGANQSQNGAPSGWSFNRGTAYAAPAGPATPPAVDVSAQTAAFASDLAALSSQLTNLQNNGRNVATKSYSGTVYDEIFTVSDTSLGYAVFNISSAELFGARNVGFVTGNKNVPIVINVSGAGGTWAMGAAGTGTWGASLNQKLLWNFAEATSLSVTNILHGSVLATNATLSNSTPIEGSVVTRTFNQGGEVHLGTFGGSDVIAYKRVVSQAVPEPATWATMVVGFGLIGGAVRRKARLARRAA